MITAVYFAKLNDHFENRMTWLRIPQVMHRFREAQTLLSHDMPDLLSHFATEDAYYLAHRDLRSLLSALVQLGLYDRFLKCSFFPQYLVGCHKGDSALNVASGQISFIDFVCNSTCQKPKAEIAVETIGGLPILAGTALTEYHVYSSYVLPSGDLRYTLSPQPARHLREIARSLAEEQKVSRWVNIGTPCKSLTALEDLGVRLVNSTELDPKLSFLQEQTPLLHSIAR